MLAITEHKRRRVECPSDDADKKKTSNRGEATQDLHQDKDKPPHEAEGLTANWHYLPHALLVYLFGFMNMLDLCRLERTYSRHVSASVRQAKRQSRSLHPSALKLSDSLETGGPLTSPPSDVATRINCIVSYYFGEYMESEKQESAVDEVKSQLECKLEVLEVIGCFTGKDLLPRLGLPR